MRACDVPFLARQNGRSHRVTPWYGSCARSIHHLGFPPSSFPWALLQPFCAECASEEQGSGGDSGVRAPWLSDMWVLTVFGAVCDKFNTQPVQVEHSLFIPFPSTSPDSLPPFPPQQRRCTTTSAPQVMDTPQTPSSANDIFSLSDQVLAERLQFIEEVRAYLYIATRPTTNLARRPPYRLATETGGAYGGVARNPTLRPNHHPTSMRRSSSQSSSYIGPKLKLPPPEFVRCTFLVLGLVDRRLYV